ncbi:hypothetical protein ALGA_4041 [Labilibaculum antarcticum]|uniref:Uncharacterized protein n=1 Tax=Labilibaculum antarcticum TaxID=1717717 RepID=A0A1Y1CQR5_9BACT|nr:hypothetical protein ALGA_4041 [Labilibaculum antarcticum]
MEGGGTDSLVWRNVIKFFRKGYKWMCDEKKSNFIRILFFFAIIFVSNKTEEAWEIYKLFDDVVLDHYPNDKV